MHVKRIFFVAALTMAMTCRVPARAADSTGAELDCHGQGQLHALVHIDYAPTKRIVLGLDAPAGGFLSGFDVEDGRTSQSNGWVVAEKVSVSDEKITWSTNATCVDSAQGKCAEGSQKKGEGSVNRYTGQLSAKTSLAPTLELTCAVLQQKF
jgi:hypothetical protein